MNKIIPLLSCFILVLMSACTEKENITEELAFHTLELRQSSGDCTHLISPNFIFCGSFCKPKEQIIITNKQKVKYRLEPCKGKTQTEKRNLTNEEIQSINDAFDLETLLNTDLNKSGGDCDNLIIVEESSRKTHTINYGSMFETPDPTKLEEIQTLIDVLTTIRESFE